MKFQTGILYQVKHFKNHYSKIVFLYDKNSGHFPVLIKAWYFIFLD